ncbi:MAG: diphthine--ammonia ligase [Candidatus Woesearchaeota archaeon]
MKCALLLSGGKDSIYAAYVASAYVDVVGAICMQSLNSESYMFHTPNIKHVTMQAKAMGIPLIMQKTQGVKEEELKDLKKAIQKAKEKWEITGIITGAVASQYQASRVQKICHELGLWCSNPLWQINQVNLLEKLVEKKFTTIISGVYAYPFDNSLLGETITKPIITQLERLQKKYHINPAGEGGEIETFVTNCPLFSHKLSVKKASKEMDTQNSGVFRIEELELIKKPKEEIIKKKDKTILPWQTHKEEYSQPADVCIISCVAKDKELFEWEYIRPLVDVCEEEHKTYCYIHLEDIFKLPAAKAIIISGTALKDNKFLQSSAKLKSIFQSEKPVLAICAGAELMALHHKEIISPCKHIGSFKIQKVKENELGEFINHEEYFLHQQGFKKEDIKTQQIIATLKDGTVALFKDKNKPHYGVQFHPELNNKKLISQFLKGIYYNKNS